MKLKPIYILLFFLPVFSCKKDNYQSPSTSLKGRILYNNEEIGLEYDRVPLEFYQPGFGKNGAIKASFAQDGSYSALLFDGNYQLIIPDGQGPFKWHQNTAGVNDTLAVTVSGNQTLDLQAVPYYLIRNAVYKVSGTDLTATFRVDQIITGNTAKNIERVNLYVNKTQFVSGSDNIVSSVVSGGAITDPTALMLKVSVPAIVPVQNYVFARIGVKIEGVEDMIFSPLQKIQL
ncbi:hypothetical protein HDF26_002223 [Pedobacter cryoconitis]|uniref:DUF3823 domain-containing protein n=1 Tax=Pedobacter cryoconitis TaxID=188932 RepID=A0A7W9DZ02_9SPHI|nr:DUF3823 domain-containing protein [Pedobacter cryoconitis]MBB5635050.1 hypothetical protein [Pedobacter cryoconitis]MBB6271766.1 hypothetical protein [Pedobacter cryoconitis]